MSEDKYVELKTMKRNNTRAAVKTRQFGKKLGLLGKSIGSASKKTYQAATSEKAKKGYKKFGRATVKVGKSAVKGVDKLSKWDGDLFGDKKTVAKRKTTRKRRKTTKPRKVVTEYY